MLLPYLGRRGHERLQQLEANFIFDSQHTRFAQVSDACLFVTQETSYFTWLKPSSLVFDVSRFACVAGKYGKNKQQNRIWAYWPRGRGRSERLVEIFEQMAWIPRSSDLENWRFLEM